MGVQGYNIFYNEEQLPYLMKFLKEYQIKAYEPLVENQDDFTEVGEQFIVCSLFMMKKPYKRHGNKNFVCVLVLFGGRSGFWKFWGDYWGRAKCAWGICEEYQESKAFHQRLYNDGNGFFISMNLEDIKNMNPDDPKYRCENWGEWFIQKIPNHLIPKEVKDNSVSIDI